MFVAIMKATLGNRVAKRADFSTEAEANEHVAAFADPYPDAFVSPTPDEPEAHWLIDMAAKTIGIAPPQPRDFSATDRIAVDRLMSESGVRLALAKTQFKLINDVRALEGQSPITVQQYKDRIEGLIRT